MTLTQLGYLVAIVEHGFNISKAAGAVHTSQPGVSRQIKLLEMELGVNILSRQGGRIIGLTEHGARVAASAKAIIKESGSLKSLGDEMLGKESGELRVSTLHSLAMTMMPKAVVAVQATYPLVVVDVQQLSAAHSFELLRTGELDFAVTIEPPPVTYDLVTLPLGTMPKVLLVPDAHPLLDKDQVKLEDIAAYPMIFSRATGANWDVTRVFQKHGIEVKPAVFVTDASVIKAFIREGAGIAVVSRASYDENQEQRLHAIDVSHMFEPSKLCIVLDPFRYMRGYGYRFIESLAPEWTPHKVDAEVRARVNASEQKRGDTQ